MAQETPTPTEETQQTEAKGRDDRFHYYSGGEVKELQSSRISPIYWVMVTIVLIGAVAYFLFGGAFGPNWVFGGYQPVGGSAVAQQQIQHDLNVSRTSVGYTTVDLNQLPIPAGQNIKQAVTNGEQVYLTYCIGCHGPNQDGNGVGASNLNPKPRNLRDAPFMQAMSYQRINTSLHKGVPGTAMPRWESTLTQDEIADVIAYVFSLTSPPADSGQGAQAGGNKAYVNGQQNTPTPITPPVGGNPAAHTTTAPPSNSGPNPAGPTPEQGHAMGTPPGTAPGLGSENAGAGPKPTTPTAGGESVKPLLQPGATTTPPTSGPVKPGNQMEATSPAAPAPKPAAPAPGGTATRP